MTLQEILDKVRGSGIDPNNVTQAVIRSDVNVTTTLNSLQFNIRDTQPNAGANNLNINEAGFRLKISDSFVVTAMRLVIYKAGTTTTPSSLEIASANEYSYPNSAVFTGGSGVEAQGFEALYKSQLTANLNKKQLYPQFGAMLFRRANTSQFGTTSAAIYNGTAPVQYKIAAEEQDGLRNGWVPLTPSFNLNGAWDMQFSLNLPTPANLAGTNSQNYVSLQFAGFLIANGSKFITDIYQ